MPNPQQPELRRSGKVAALDPDATETRLTGEDRPASTGGTGPVPEEQRPGHHPEREQDKPDLDDFAARLGIVPEGEEPEDAPRVEVDDGTGPRTPEPDTAPRGAGAGDGTAASGADDGTASVTDLDDAPSRVQAREATTTAPTAPSAGTRPPGRRLEISPIGLLLIGPTIGFKVARGVFRTVVRRGR